MGYSEQLCQLCGVSFNVGRIRTAEDPQTAAWECHRGAGENTYITGGPDDIRNCGPDSGCTVTDRGKDQDDFLSPWKDLREGIENGDIDAGYNVDGLEPEPDPEYLDEGMFDGRHTWEHIAGPECQSTEGYRGSHITYAEMKGARTVQCLVRKREPFTSEADDEDFELEGNFFLSGLGDGMPDTEISGDMKTFPMHRHGAQVGPANVHWDASFVLNNDMPFHTWCLEVYKRVSLHTLGHIDMIGLHGWYDNEADYDLFHDKFSRHGDIRHLQEQWWYHEHGSEYVVSNPLFIPALPALLQTCISADPAFSTSNGAFNIPPEDLVAATSGDPFTSLPTELRLMILNELSAKDIANLRLTSRAFRQLPISLWHSLVSKEIPWLWEAWDEKHNIPFSFWATTTMFELRRNPGVTKGPTPVPDQLPLAQTNWYQLYKVIKENQNVIKGLRNRERIWHDCAEILRRIVGYRDVGSIPLSTKDAEEIVKRRDEERYAQRAAARS